MASASSPDQSPAASHAGVLSPAQRVDDSGRFIMLDAAPHEHHPSPIAHRLVPAPPANGLPGRSLAVSAFRLSPWLSLLFSRSPINHQPPTINHHSSIDPRPIAPSIPSCSHASPPRLSAPWLKCALSLLTACKGQPSVC
ncbi:hypothetical protein BGW36DRAFT_150394 [Talaromyces proteolyticus]|uniref:Uncharacterized protein n=1 Tax=Talaromyces proteolyticus TaxID=1131652 RepID=A0AAD4KT57_9EURO|nr:uncharacterized protein BGW36DRAFT_150394 [Talaromyces proteolyticus]KAH8698776.1 hypothetical protein BGW36DRAFT_150394 [Talaromyces proteolyticus]